MIKKNFPPKADPPRAEKKDYILMILAILFLAVISGAFIWNKSSNRRFSSGVATPEIIGRAALTVDFGNGRTRSFEGEIVRYESLVDALNQAAKAGNFSAANSRSRRWYLNGIKVAAPPNKVYLKNGDEILVKYE